MAGGDKELPMSSQLHFTRGAQGTFDSRVSKRRNDEQEQQVRGKNSHASWVWGPLSYMVFVQLLAVASGERHVDLTRLKELQQQERYEKFSLNSRFAYNTMRNAWQRNRQLDIQQVGDTPTLAGP